MPNAAAVTVREPVSIGSDGKPPSSAPTTTVAPITVTARAAITASPAISSRRRACHSHSRTLPPERFIASGSMASCDLHACSAFPGETRAVWLQSPAPSATIITAMTSVRDVAEILLLAAAVAGALWAAWSARTSASAATKAAKATEEALGLDIKRRIRRSWGVGTHGREVRRDWAATHGGAGALVCRARVSPAASSHHPGGPSGLVAPPPSTRARAARARRVRGSTACATDSSYPRLRRPPLGARG